MNHTPGPWRAEPKWPFRDLLNDGIPILHTDEAGMTTVITYAWRTDPKIAAVVRDTDAMANAALIAAAPELLAACIALQRQGGLCWCIDWHEQGNAGECPDCVTRVAIAKATGAAS